MKLTSKNINSILLYVLGIIIFMIPAIINGYPVVYSDASTYLESGFILETPFDRPITYGVFLRLFSFNGLTLWTVIALQSLIVTYVCIRFVNVFFESGRYRNTLSYVLMILLSLFTSASWTTVHIMPDIFSSLMFMIMAIILMEKISLRDSIFLYFLFFLLTAMHMSHVSFNISFLLLILILRMIKKTGLRKIKLKKIFILIVLTVLSIGTMGSALSKSKHVFFMGALVEHGIAKEYLDEYCGERDYKLCKYKDSLPEKAWQFVWDENSPLYKIGSFKGTKDEFNEIITNTLTEPKYIKMHIVESFKATFEQLFRFKIGDGNGVFLQNTMLYKRLKKYVPNDIEMYKSSMQNQSKLGFLKHYNVIQQVFMALIALIFILLLIYFNYRKINKKYLRYSILFISAIFLNAWICGTFANAIDRLGAKMMWLIPLIGIIGLFKAYQFKKT